MNRKLALPQSGHMSARLAEELVDPAAAIVAPLGERALAAPAAASAAEAPSPPLASTLAAAPTAASWASWAVRSPLFLAASCCFWHSASRLVSRSAGGRHATLRRCSSDSGHATRRRSPPPPRCSSRSGSWRAGCPRAAPRGSTPCACCANSSARSRQRAAVRRSIAGAIASAIRR